MCSLVPIFADQLSHNLSSLKSTDKCNSIVLMVEVRAEANTVWHHRQKLVFLFSAMRHFASELETAGWRVDYVKLDDPQNSGNFEGEVTRAIARHNPAKITLTEPSEYRVFDLFKSIQDEIDTPVDILVDDRFLCSHDQFKDWASGRKSLRMEYFYREIRKATGLLMKDGAPEGDNWNFDSENRKPAKANLLMPKPLRFKPDCLTTEVLKMVEENFPDRYGELSSFAYAVTRSDALKALSHFVANRLAFFGDYQDAMLTGEPFLYHSLLSAYLNVGLLDPLEICHAVEDAYAKGDVPLNAAEGYIRQIIGWREYVRGIYWLNMPTYLERNALTANAPLPEYYWTSQTKMTCMANALAQTKEHAYAHHIQRLMVTGNFSLIAGINPYALHEWYLAVYIDAFEWVEAPNTIGMSQYADGGILASKPYASSGNYINKMSDYCKSCHYNVKVRTGSDACPFNTLYWDFISRHEADFKSNPRMAQMVRIWNRFEASEKTAITQQATYMKANLSSL